MQSRPIPATFARRICAEVLTMNLSKYIYGCLMAFSLTLVARYGCAHTRYLARVHVSAWHGCDTLPSRWEEHAQVTGILQHQFPFHDPYDGPLSLKSHEAPRFSLTATAFLGMRLWPGTALHVDPELSGGRGLSGTSGVAGFPNGEVYRVGDPHPVLNLARGYLTQVINLSKDREWISSEESTLPLSRASERLELNVGKFALSDFFDGNSFSHDPRTQFLNWALMDAGAWDYAADTRGYTLGAVLAYFSPSWNLRSSLAMLPTSANGNVLDTHLAKAHALSLQWEEHTRLVQRPLVFRMILWNNIGRMGSYAKALALDPFKPDVTQTRSYGRGKSGFVFNLESDWSAQLGFFARFSWNDGQNETWAFTEIDRSIQAGAQLDGSSWDRSTDRLGLACVVNGLSQSHRAYLAAGGQGFILGDGQLSYGKEAIVEGYYAVHVAKMIYLSPDFQIIVNPAYNRDRGPVSVLAIRLHIEQ